jgi:hypothetical protein
MRLGIVFLLAVSFSNCYKNNDQGAKSGGNSQTSEINTAAIAPSTAPANAAGSGLALTTTPDSSSTTGTTTEPSVSDTPVCDAAIDPTCSTADKYCVCGKKDGPGGVRSSTTCTDKRQCDDTCTSANGYCRKSSPCTIDCQVKKNNYDEKLP